MADKTQSKGTRIAAWIMSGLLTLVFLGAGVPKLLGLAEPAAAFERYGYPLWFLRVTGLIEVLCAIGLFVPRVRGLAAAGIVATMAGAVGTHIWFAEGAQAAVPAVFLLLGAVLTYLRREELPLVGADRAQGAKTA